MPQRPLDQMSAKEILALMDKADARALKAVQDARGVLADAAECAATAIRQGGRLIYVGAGTSGRLGVLDASECPPTFSSKPEQVVGVIAGGMKALSKSVEGAEDDTGAGRAAMSRLKVGAADMVVGISASGNTPYVLAALEEAERRGADTWLLTCKAPDKSGSYMNDPLPTLSHAREKVITSTPLAPEWERGWGRGCKLILIDTGPEVIQGSTRLAAGTATKLALNRITTGAFIMLGKVYGDLMVDVMPTNAKLITRAAGIIVKLTGCPDDEARSLLRKSGGSAKVAALMKLRGVSAAKARTLLLQSGGSLREALDEKP